MLASTVQFSSNDQPPITPTPEGLKFTGAGVPKTDLAAVPSGPNNVPDTHHPHEPALHAPKRSTRDPKDRAVPNSQRSTHELATVRQALTTWHCAP